MSKCISTVIAIFLVANHFIFSRGLNHLSISSCISGRIFKYIHQIYSFMELKFVFNLFEILRVFYRQVSENIDEDTLLLGLPKGKLFPLSWQNKIASTL
jgi:ABC-type uncharacterized transport system permease subunit